MRECDVFLGTNRYHTDCFRPDLFTTLPSCSFSFPFPTTMPLGMPLHRPLLFLSFSFLLFFSLLLPHHHLVEEECQVAPIFGRVAPLTTRLMALHAKKGKSPFHSLPFLSLSPSLSADSLLCLSLPLHRNLTSSHSNSCNSRLPHAAAPDNHLILSTQPPLPPPLALSFFPSFFYHLLRSNGILADLPSCLPPHRR